MKIFQGHASTGIQSKANEDSPFLITNFIITNTDDLVTAIINLYIVTDDEPAQLISICPKNLQIGIGQAYADRNYFIKKGQAFNLVIVSGEVDFYFLTDNTNV